MMKFNLTKTVSILGVITLSLIVAWFLAVPINLTTADLGRHIKNGELVWHSLSEGKGLPSIVYENTYSYTHPDFPSPNHHWASGLLFFSMHNAFGFTGLSLLYIGCMIVAFALMLFATTKHFGFRAAFLSAMIAAPLLWYRDEVRPEVFSYLFAAVFVWVLSHPSLRQRTSFWFLSILQLLWVNTHIYFFLGPALVGVFLVDALLQKNRKRVHHYLALLGLTLVVSLINPFGFKGIIYPFLIFSNYGYRVLENQTLWFLKGVNIFPPVFLYFVIVCAVVVLLCIFMVSSRKLSASEAVRDPVHRFNQGYWAMYSGSPMSGALLGDDTKGRKGNNGMNGLKGSNGTRIQWWSIILVGAGIVLGCMAVRNLAVAGLFIIPGLAYGMGAILQRLKGVWASGQVYTALCLISASVVCIVLLPWIQARALTQGIGLEPGVEQAGNFLRTANIRGPFFNNYDIGGYLIYYLNPKEQVFVDNRPESYPASFFQDMYIPMQERQDVWQAVDSQYYFNAVVFQYRDLTPWGQTFLRRIIQDPAWAPVYADSRVLILLKRNEQNQPLIEQFELPVSLFRFSS